MGSPPGPVMVNEQAGPHTAFFYGTLMARQVLYRVIYGASSIQNNPAYAARAATLTIQPAILHGYCRHRVRLADYPGIIPQEGESVRGTYVTGLNDADMQRLDFFEGTEYRRDKVQAVPLTNGEADTGPDAPKVDTETYVYTAGDRFLEKGEWDFDDFVKNRMPGVWTDDHSEEYEGLGMVDAGAGDTTGGRGIGTEMTRDLNGLEKA